MDCTGFGFGFSTGGGFGGLLGQTLSTLSGLMSNCKMQRLDWVIMCKFQYSHQNYVQKGNVLHYLVKRNKHPPVTA